MAIIDVEINTDLLQLPEIFQAFMYAENIERLGKELRMNLKKVYANSDLLFCIDEYDSRLVAIKYLLADNPFYIYPSTNVKTVILVSSKLTDGHKNHIALFNTYDKSKIHYIGVDIHFSKLKKQVGDGVATSFWVVA